MSRDSRDSQVYFKVCTFFSIHSSGVSQLVLFGSVVIALSSELKCAGRKARPRELRVMLLFDFGYLKEIMIFDKGQEIFSCLSNNGRLEETIKIPSFEEIKDDLVLAYIAIDVIRCILKTASQSILSPLAFEYKCRIGNIDALRRIIELF